MWLNITIYCDFLKQIGWRFWCVWHRFFILCSQCFNCICVVLMLSFDTMYVVTMLKYVWIKDKEVITDFALNIHLNNWEKWIEIYQGSDFFCPTLLQMSMRQDYINTERLFSSEESFWFNMTAQIWMIKLAKMCL